MASKPTRLKHVGEFRAAPGLLLRHEAGKVATLCGGEGAKQFPLQLDGLAASRYSQWPPNASTEFEAHKPLSTSARIAYCELIRNVYIELAAGLFQMARSLRAFRFQRYLRNSI